MRFTYLLVDLCSVALPALFSFHPRLRFYKEFKPYFLGNLIAAICFISWDIAFTENGVWGFNQAYIIGIRIAGLPIEEILFFFCIPFACVFTFHCLGIFFKKRKINFRHRWFTTALILILLVLGAVYRERAYTSVTFISAALLLAFIALFRNPPWMSSLYLSYLFLLLPFFIVNGILTGTGLNEPVVWYNNSQNLGIRLLTIPVEDLVYGFELILLTVFFYKSLKLYFSPGSAERPAARGKSGAKLFISQTK